MTPLSETVLGKLFQGRDKSVVGSRWIYKVKQAIDGSVEKYKAIFVARGFSQIKGIDYEETFAPVARYSSIRHKDHPFSLNAYELAHSSNGCEDCVSQWDH